MSSHASYANMCKLYDELKSELSATKDKLDAAETAARDASFDLISVKKDLFQAERENAELRKHLERLGSVESFVLAGSMNPEAIARIDYARKALEPKP